MTTENDLIMAIKETLKNDGTLGKFKAEMRTKIMDILNGEITVEKPHLSKETLLLNELIREYLTWSGYKYTKSVFVQESGLSSEPFSRSKLLESLGVCDTEESSKFPVLHGIIAAFKEDLKKDSEMDLSKGKTSMSDLDEEFSRIVEAINEGKSNFLEDEQNIIDSWISKLSEPKETTDEQTIRNDYARLLERLVNKEKQLRQPFLRMASDVELLPLSESNGRFKGLLKKIPCSRPRSSQGTGAILKKKRPDRSPSTFSSYETNEFESAEEMAKVIARSKGQSLAEFIMSISRETADYGQELRAAMKAETNSFKDYVDHVLSQRIKDLTEVLDEEQNRELQRIKKDIERWQLELSNVKKRVKEMIPDFDLELFKNDKNYLKNIFKIDTPMLPEDDTLKRWTEESCHRLKWISNQINQISCCNERTAQEIACIKSETMDLEGKEIIKQQSHIKRINLEISEYQKVKSERDKLYKEKVELMSQLQDFGQ